MTLPPVVRVFFAIDLSPEAKDEIGKFIAQLKKKSKSHAIRWSRPENLHVTLQFLAEVQSEDIEKVIDSVRAQISSKQKPFSLALGSLEIFPSPYRPRVIVLEITEQAEITKLSEMIGAGIQAAGYAIEERPFRAHLTIGRIKHPHGVQLNFLNEVDGLQLPKQLIDTVHFFRSEPKPEGSHYTVIERIMLN